MAEPGARPGAKSCDARSGSSEASGPTSHTPPRSPHSPTTSRSPPKPSPPLSPLSHPPLFLPPNRLNLNAPSTHDGDSTSTTAAPRPDVGGAPPLGGWDAAEGVFFLSLDPFLPYVRAHSSHISPLNSSFDGMQPHVSRLLRLRDLSNLRATRSASVLTDVEPPRPKRCPPPPHARAF